MLHQNTDHPRSIRCTIADACEDPRTRIQQALARLGAFVFFVEGIAASLTVLHLGALAIRKYIPIVLKW